MKLCLHKVYVLLILKTFTNATSPLSRIYQNLFKVQSLDPRIVGGRMAQEGEFPYQVSIRYIEAHICGGSILDELHILSAAHCFFDIFGHQANPKFFTILAGSKNQKSPNEGVQIIQVESFQIHEKFNPKNATHDIGIFKLMNPLVFTDKVQPISLAESSPESGNVCTVTGWGYLEEGSGNVPDELYAVNVTSITNKICKELYEVDGHPDEIKEDMICFLEDGKDACQGDSGGPIACDNILSGVVSFGDGCAKPQVPGVYASVAYYRKWILSKLN